MTHDQYNVSEEELKEWQQAMRDVKAYQPRQMVVTPSDRPTKPPHRAQEALSFPKAPKACHLPPLVAGKFVGVDAATVKRIKRGQMPMEASVDLHGLTQESAFSALQRAVMQALIQRKRLMLVITGKGSGGEGILKTSLPKWLNDEALRPYLLAFDWARREDGGSGAAYVLLKKLVVTDHADDFSGR